jgi:hypothetical protein
MSPSLTTFSLAEPIFADANIFLFHALNDQRFGKAAARHRANSSHNTIAVAPQTL